MTLPLRMVYTRRLTVSARRPTVANLCSNVGSVANEYPSSVWPGGGTTRSGNRNGRSAVAELPAHDAVSATSASSAATRPCHITVPRLTRRPSFPPVAGGGDGEERREVPR